MAGYVLHLTEEENIVLSAPTVRRLIDAGNGDAALLYLCLVRNHGSMSPEKLMQELHWSGDKLDAAQRALAHIGLVGAPREERESERTPPVPQVSSVPPQTAELSREDMMRTLETDEGFAALLREVERKLGRLSEPSVRKLLGLYDTLGLPADVIFLLVNHCIERRQEQYGEGRLPAMRDIEREGYRWAERELFSTAAASEYLRREQARRSRYPEYMAALKLDGRPCVPSEERYLAAWTEMGFPPETVALAYDKTVLKCHEFKWSYCNGILKKWHEKGLHTPQEAASEKSAPKKTGVDKNAWMDEYL